jgi:hypothetical protein
MPFCTIVEFEWDETFDHEQFASTISAAFLAAAPLPAPSRVVGFEVAYYVVSAPAS